MLLAWPSPGYGHARDRVLADLLVPRAEVMRGRLVDSCMVALIGFPLVHGIVSNHPSLVLPRGIEYWRLTIRTCSLEMAKHPLTVFPGKGVRLPGALCVRKTRVRNSTCLPQGSLLVMQVFDVSKVPSSWRRPRIVPGPPLPFTSIRRLDKKSGAYAQAQTQPSLRALWLRAPTHNPVYHRDSNGYSHTLCLRFPREIFIDIRPLLKMPCLKLRLAPLVSSGCPLPTPLLRLPRVVMSTLRGKGETLRPAQASPCPKVTSRWGVLARGLSRCVSISFPNERPAW